MAAKHSAIAGHVRRLCLLGADPRIVMPHIVEAVRSIAGAEWGMFFYADRRYELRDVYSQNAAVFDVMPVYFSSIHNTEKQAVLGVDFRTAMQRGMGYGNSLDYDSELLASALYGELWQPLKIRHSLELTVTDGRRGWGSLQFARPPGSRPFTQRNCDDIAPLSRHMAHAVSCPLRAMEHHVRYGLSAILLTDRAGKIVMQNKDGAAIISLSTGEPALTEVRRLPEWLTPLLRSFHTGWRGESAPAPRMERINAAGRFVFRAYSFDARATSPVPECIAVYAEHFPPLRLEIESRGYALGLSERQRQLCTHLVLGHSQSDTARLMNIRDSTVMDHVKKIYRKLDIHGHDELKTLFYVEDLGRPRN